MSQPAYANLGPDGVLDAIDSLGLRCDGTLLQLNSHERPQGRLADPGGAHEKTPGRPKFSQSTSRLASRSDSAPSRLPQGSLEPRASSPSGGLTRTRQVWGHSQGLRLMEVRM
ncbi:MAG: hypothetical protein AB7S67_01025 [Thiomonas sp.]